METKAASDSLKTTFRDDFWDKKRCFIQGDACRKLWQEMFILYKIKWELPCHVTDCKWCATWLSQSPPFFCKRSPIGLTASCLQPRQTWYHDVSASSDKVLSVLLCLSTPVVLPGNWLVLRTQPVWNSLKIRKGYWGDRAREQMRRREHEKWEIWGNRGNTGHHMQPSPLTCFIHLFLLSLRHSELQSLSSACLCARNTESPNLNHQVNMHTKKAWGGDR